MASEAEAAVAAALKSVSSGLEDRMEHFSADYDPEGDEANYPWALGELADELRLAADDITA
ncbi:hypothetical protein [Streptomyces rimosus]|uniref:hypothetical protein n=1 Tax=Streptomyces rimosus TaxID=1927 RepID=UPI0004C93CA7|nr:hypothetical protein [Streptomyces rimosus]